MLAHCINTCICVFYLIQINCAVLKEFLRASYIFFLKPRLHYTACCQIGLYHVYKHSTGCQTRFDNRFDKRLCRVYSRLSNRLYNPGWQPVERTVVVRSTRLPNQLLNRVVYNRFDNRLQEQWLFVQHGCQLSNQLLNRFDKPVWQPVVSCKRSLRNFTLLNFVD